MTPAALLLLAFGALLAAGFGLARLTQPSAGAPGELPATANVGATLLLGPLGIAALLAACSAIGWNWNRWLPPLVGAALLVAGARRKSVVSLPRGTLAALLAVGAALAWAALQTPIYISDPVNIYATPALLYAEHGAIHPAHLLSVTEPSHLDYPPLFTLNLAWIFHALGGYDAWWIKLLGALFGLGLLVELSHIAFATGARGWPRLALTLLFGATPMVFKETTSGFADIALTAYLAGFLAALLQSGTGDRGALLRAILYGAAAGATKNEGLVLVLLFCGLAFLCPAVRFAGRRRRLALIAAVVLASALPWQGWVRSHGIENDLVEGMGSVGVAEAVERLPTIVTWLAADTWHSIRIPPLPAEDALRLPPFGAVFPLFLAALAWRIVRLLRLQRPLGPWFAPAHVALIVLVFAFTPRDLEWHLDTAAPRLLLQMLPAIALFTTETFFTPGTRPRSDSTT